MYSLPNYSDLKYLGTRMTLMLFRSLGLAPFSIRTYRDRQHRGKSDRHYRVSTKFSTSKIGTIYNLGIVAVWSVVIFFAIGAVCDNVYPDKSVMTVLVETTSSGLGSIAIAIIWLEFVLKRKNVVRITNRLLSTDDSTIYRHDRHRPESIGRFVLLTFVVNFGLWFWRVYSSLTAYIYLPLSYVAYFVMPILLTFFVAQYAFAVKLMEKRFEAVNRMLVDSCAFASTNILSESLFARKLGNNCFPKPTISKANSVHTKLCEVASEISDFYSVPIFLVVGYQTLMVIYESYYLAYPIFIANDTLTVGILINATFSLLTQILPIIQLADCVTRACREGRRTADIVRQLQTVFDIGHHDQQELDDFLLELLHRKIEFTACDIFPLDNTIVQSMFSTTVTYLIILVQFRRRNISVQS